MVSVKERFAHTLSPILVSVEQLFAHTFCPILASRCQKARRVSDYAKKAEDLRAAAKKTKNSYKKLKTVREVMSI